MVARSLPAPPAPADQPWRARSWLARHRASLLALSAATAVVGAVMCWNLQGYPGRADDDEGTYVNRAWAMLSAHHLSNYTYFWDHPFFGWAQLAAWAGLTNGLSVSSRAVMAGREFMLALTVASCVLLYALARRLGMSRVFATAAVLLFGLSPVDIWYHRMISLDNPATTWALAAFVAAASPRRSLGAAVTSAVCFAAATWSKETILLLLPALLWLLGQQAGPRIRKKYLLVFLFVWAGIVGLYPLLAILKGELLPGPGHVSLLGQISYQLASRQGTGSVLDVHSQTFAQARSWVELDPWLTFGGLGVLAAGLAIRRLRPVALALAVQLAYMVKGGYVPYAYLTAMLPFAALLVPGVLDELWRRRQASPAGRLLTRLPVVIVAVVFAVAVLPRWGESLHAQAGANGFANEDAAVTWMADHAPAGAIVVCDAYPWLDLKLRSRAAPLYMWQIDNDPEVMRDLLPHGYQDISYLLLEPSSPITFTALPGRPTLQAAIAHSSIIRRFGSIDIYQVDRHPGH